MVLQAIRRSVESIGEQDVSATIIIQHCWLKVGPTRRNHLKNKNRKSEFQNEGMKINDKDKI